MCVFAQDIYTMKPVSSKENVGEICKWDYNKKAAIVLTFDDWTPGQFPLVVPALKRNKMVATFFPILSNVEKSELGWKAIQTAQKNGNEIGNHSLSHPDLTKLSDKDLQNEIRTPQNEICKNLPSYRVVSFAYPYGAGADNQRVIDSLRASGHVGARSVWGEWNYTYDFAQTDDDYYRIQIFGMNEQTKNSKFFSDVEKTIAGGGLLTFLYHSVDDDLGSYNDTWYAQVKLDSLKAQLKFLKKHQNDIWVTTFGNAILYHREANCASFSEYASVEENKNDKRYFSLNITDKNFLQLVPQESFVPLSVLVFKKSKEHYSTVVQGDTTIPIDVQTDTYIQFRVVPNGKDLIVVQ